MPQTYENEFAIVRIWHVAKFPRKFALTEVKIWKTAVIFLGNSKWLVKVFYTAPFGEEMWICTISLC